MRVSTNYVSDQIIQNLNIDLGRLQSINQQVSTGQRIQVPSDDPLASQRVVNLNEALNGINQYQRNAQYVGSWSSTSESALTGTFNSLQSANGLAIRAANDATLTQADWNTMADQVDGILKSVVAAANTQSEGKTLFGGFQTLTPAYQTTLAGGVITAVTYAGDNGVEQVEVDSGVTVNKNVPGSQIFQPAAGTDVFATLINLRDSLRAGNAAGIQAGIAATQAAHDQVVDQVSLIGNKTKMMDMVSQNLTDKKTALTTLNSQLADTDMPEAIVRLQTAQNVYTAALESSARIMQQQSLVDFLK